MNILIVSNRLPYPPYRGDKLKIYNLAKRLCKNHTIYLATFLQEKDDYKYLKDLERIFKKIIVVYLPSYLSKIKCGFGIPSNKPFNILYFRSKKLRKLINEFVTENKIDVVYTQHLRMSQYTYAFKNVKKVLDLPDAYSLYWKRRASVKKNIFNRLISSVEESRIIKYEEILHYYDLILVCSDEDKEYLIKTHGLKNIKILPNGVDLDHFHSDNHNYSKADRIIFTGFIPFSPNVDAVCYFVKEIFPEVLNRFPQVRFYIVGQKPTKRVLRLQSDKVIVTGMVKDLSAEYDKSSVAVSPIRYGAGTMNKVLEPMAVGVPVVSTPVGFSGLKINPGEGVILASTTREFTDCVIKLLSDENLRRTTGQLGKKVIQEKYSWDSIAQQLEGYFLEIVN